ncbi:MAG: pyridoxamine 5'-phosphate oxidase family protein [Candidatus Hodarchaeales archaeon]|jgi:nitroimidazol reductase NimA-like FMN-containing flavoprotein (pyridoxamine 5'-phosphate oxidase superfamily)
MNSQTKTNSKIPSYMIKFLLNARYLHCCTIDRNHTPHIVPLIFFFDEKKGLILCVAEKKSNKVKNMQINPYVTFSTDKTHRNNPLLNTGVMIETVVELIDDDNEIVEVMANLQEKYNTILDSKLLAFRVFDSDILIKAHLMKIVHWKGPYFQRYVFSKHRKKDNPFWSKNHIVAY